jgi:protein TonB
MNMARLRYRSDSTLAQSRDSGTLSLFIAGSFILHLAAGAALPAFRATSSAVKPLQVTIEAREPPPVTPPVPLPLASAPPRAAEPPRPKPVPKKKIAQPPVEKPAPAPAPPPVLALPQTAPTPEVAVPVPAPQKETPAVAARDEKPAQAEPGPSAARAAPLSEKAGSAKTTPPVSDAAYLRNPQPRYPMSARRKGEQGTVLLKVLVTREGSAASVSVDKSSGSTVLDDAALDAVRKWRFVPALRGGQPVEAWHLVPIVFRLEGTS